MGAKVLPAGTGVMADVFAFVEELALARPDVASAADGSAPAGVPADEAGRIKAWLAVNQSSVSAKATPSAAGGEDLELAILGAIGGGWWSDGVTAKGVRAILDQNKSAKSIRVLIDSPGGDYFDGVAIMNMLKRHPAQVTVEVIGEATSAGSVIAMGGDRIEMHTGTMMMIHRAWSLAMGNADELRSSAEMLDKVDAGLVQIYAARASKKPEALKALVDATTWMTAKEAIDQGLADAELPAIAKKAKVPAPASATAKTTGTVSAGRIEITLAEGTDPNAAAAACIRALSPEPAPLPAPASAAAPTPPTNPDPSGPGQQPTRLGKEEPNMSTPENSITPAVIRAMGLPAGSTEQDVLAAATRMRELELGVMTLTGVSNSSEALGAVRGIKAAADGAAKLGEQLSTVQAQRDQQNFSALIMKGTSAPVKLSPAQAKFYQDKFDVAAKADADAKDGQGRSEAVVNDLQGFLNIAPTIIHSAQRQPIVNTRDGGNGNAPPVNATWNGKAFADLKGLERARLNQEEPELYALMRQDWLDAGSPQPTAKSA